MKIVKENSLCLNDVKDVDVSIVVKELILDEVHEPDKVTTSVKVQLAIDLGIVKQLVTCDVPKDLKDLLLQYYKHLGGQ